MNEKLMQLLQLERELDAFPKEGGTETVIEYIENGKRTVKRWSLPELAHRFREITADMDLTESP